MKFNFYPFNITSQSDNDHKMNAPLRRGLVIMPLMLLMSSSLSFGQPSVSYIFHSPGTFAWTCPEGVMSATIECWGGGGAGGGATTGTNNFAGGGGGGGAYVIDTFAVVPNVSYALFVGAGGLGTPGGKGTDGDSSWFNSRTSVMALGGGGGYSGAQGATGLGYGGTGASASSCIPSANANSGGNGLQASTDNLGLVASGAGGAGGQVLGVTGAMGAPGVITSAGQNGNDGIPPGGGGSGGVDGNVVTNPAGGNGSSGEVKITFLYSVPVVNFASGNGFNAKAFPNPTGGKTTVQFNAEASAAYTIKVFDLTGRELINKEGKTGEGINMIGLDMTRYAKDIYMINLLSGKNHQLIKLLVQ